MKLTKSEIILENLKSHYGYKTDLELAERLGYKSTGTLSGWKERDSVNWKRIEKHCPDVDLSMLLDAERIKTRDHIEREKKSIRDVEAYEQHVNDHGAGKKEREILLEYLQEQADSLAKGIRLLKQIDR